MKGIARGNWDPREGQQPFRPNPNGVGDRNTTLRRLLIGAASIGSRATCHHFSACVFPILHHASQKNMNVQKQMRKRPTKHEIFSNSICFQSCRKSSQGNVLSISSNSVTKSFYFRYDFNRSLCAFCCINHV